MAMQAISLDAYFNEDQQIDMSHRSLPENCVEYLLFVIDNTLAPRKILTELEAVRKTAMKLSDSLTKEYIWQRDAFNLEVKAHQGLYSPHESNIQVAHSESRLGLSPWHDQLWGFCG